jgi:hypothetical protein
MESVEVTGKSCNRDGCEARPGSLRLESNELTSTSQRPESLQLYPCLCLRYEDMRAGVPAGYAAWLVQLWRAQCPVHGGAA